MPSPDPAPGAPPVPADALPSRRTLRRSALAAAVVALVLLVTAVLPAEFDVDPTGIGARLGLKEIGEVKREGIEEAAEAARIDSARAAADTTAAPPAAGR